MFYALARPLLEYVIEAAVIGIATIRGTGRERYRYWSLVGFSAAAIAEAYYVLTSSISLVGDPVVGMVSRSCPEIITTANRQKDTR